MSSYPHAPRRTPLRLTALLAALTLLAAACGGSADPEAADSGSDAATTATTTATTTEDVADPTTGGTVTLVTHDSFAVSDEVLAAFEEESGITVELLEGGDAGETVNQAILTNGNPQGDVLFGVDNSFLSRALDEDLFVAYEAAGIGDVDPRYRLDEQNRVTPVDYGDVCLNYDKSAFTDREPPQTLEDLTDPAYKGEIVVENPATSSPGLAFLLASVERFGEDGWRDWWSELAANDITVSQGWEDAYYGQFSGGSGEGDKPIVVSYASSPVAEVVFADPQPDESPTGVVLDSCFRQIEFAGILNGAANEEGAKKLIDFLISPAFQEDIPLNMFVFPVNTQAVLPPAFEQFAEVADDPIEMSPDRIAEGRDGWIRDWTETVLR